MVIGHVWSPELYATRYKKPPSEGFKNWEVAPGMYVAGWLLDTGNYPPIDGCYKIKHYFRKGHACHVMH